VIGLLIREVGDVVHLERDERFLEEHNIAVVLIDETRIQSVGSLAENLLATTTQTT
jgi:hypothetical protein